VSLRKRLTNLARAELKNAAKKAASLIDGSADQDDRLVDEELERMRREEAAQNTKTNAKSGSGSKSGSKKSAAAGGESAIIRRYYANLELPIGASLAEVKAAYRRLMRRYHPDLHQADGEKAAVATRLAQELRTAYEGLVAHLER